MAEPCCRPMARSASLGRCPVSGGAGVAVSFTTIAAMTVGALPARQPFRLCLDRECEVVYYGEDGLVLGVERVRSRPWDKLDGGVICHCFEVGVGDLIAGTAAPSGATIVREIERRVASGDCACEVRSPAGRCCLKEMRAMVARAERSIEP
jgi:Zinc binding domain